MLAGVLFEILRNGCVMFVDELDRSLHALLVQELVGMFQNSNRNPGGAQLIFTTHDTSLLSANLLRRDQIWLVDKDADQASKVYPLTEFAPRKNEALERGYLYGRYGAIPILKHP
jgi:AAA15 family ATPase/GTPase